MKRRHHSPEQIVRKLREADRLLGGKLRWWRCVGTCRSLSNCPTGELIRPVVPIATVEA